VTCSAGGITPLELQVRKRPGEAEAVRRPGIRWAGATVAPAVLAILLVGLVIVLHVIRADRS